MVGHRVIAPTVANMFLLWRSGSFTIGGNGQSVRINQTTTHFRIRSRGPTGDTRCGRRRNNAHYLNISDFTFLGGPALELAGRFVTCPEAWFRAVTAPRSAM
jgi:hypothetical protein